MPITVGVLGLGHIGQFIVERLVNKGHPQYIGNVAHLAFVWNRSLSKVKEAQANGLNIKDDQILENLDDLSSQFPAVDLIVEVAHPTLYQSYGEKLIAHSSIFVGSPTALADEDVFSRLKLQAKLTSHALYFPTGALWGATDVLKMGEACSIASIHISMRKPPHSFKLIEPLESTLNEYIKTLETSGFHEPLVLYRGSVRGLCPLAPNNVNTMACLAIASGDELGFEGCTGELVADPNINAHIIEITLKGKPIKDRDDVFEVTVRRFNPCDPFLVTASATFPSFVASLKKVAEMGSLVQTLTGIHFV